MVKLNLKRGFIFLLVPLVVLLAFLLPMLSASVAVDLAFDKSLSESFKQSFMLIIGLVMNQNFLLWTVPILIAIFILASLDFEKQVELKC